MSRWLAQYVLLIMFRSLPAWLLVCVLPLVAGTEASAARTAGQPYPVSDGMDLLRQGIAGNMCTLTFDDGPSQFTPQLLDTLKQYNVKATFFVVGSQVKRRPELIRRMLEEGHEVGNHSYSHHMLRRQSAEEQQADLRKLDTVLRELGATPRFVRPPYGSYDHNTVNVVQEMDGHLVMWTADSQDWRKKSNLENVLANMRMIYTGAPMRGVFLFHDTHRLTVENMPQILDALAATGCRFVTLSEYIDSPKTEQTAESGQPAAAPGGAQPVQREAARQAAVAAALADLAQTSGRTAGMGNPAENGPSASIGLPPADAAPAAVSPVTSTVASVVAPIVPPISPQDAGADGAPVASDGKAVRTMPGSSLLETISSFFSRLLGQPPAPAVQSISSR